MILILLITIVHHLFFIWFIKHLYGKWKLIWLAFPKLMKSTYSFIQSKRAWLRNFPFTHTTPPLTPPQPLPSPVTSTEIQLETYWTDFIIIIIFISGQHLTANLLLQPSVCEREREKGERRERERERREERGERERREGRESSKHFQKRKHVWIGGALRLF